MPRRAATGRAGQGRLGGGPDRKHRPGLAGRVGGNRRTQGRAPLTGRRAGPARAGRPRGRQVQVSGSHPRRMEGRPGPLRLATGRLTEGRPPQRGGPLLITRSHDLNQSSTPEARHFRGSVDKLARNQRQLEAVLQGGLSLAKSATIDYHFFTYLPATYLP